MEREKEVRVERIWTLPMKSWRSIGLHNNPEVNIENRLIDWWIEEDYYCTNYSLVFEIQNEEQNKEQDQAWWYLPSQVTKIDLVVAYCIKIKNDRLTTLKKDPFDSPRKYDFAR